MADQLVRRISEVGFAVYAPDKKDPAFDGGLFARVDDAPAFIAGTVELLKQVREATKDKDKDKAEVTFEQKTLAGRPSWVIRREEKDKPKDREAPAFLWPPALVLSELDAQSVFIAMPEKADRAEALIRKVAEGAKGSLNKNAGLQKTAATLPEKLQLAVYLNIEPLGFFSGLTTNPEECPPVAFALRALPAGLEAQFVVPFETLRAVVKADKAAKKKQPKEK
jgi:hypothetical protein